jgi:hypothetical protein
METEATLSPETIAAMRAWCEDVFSDYDPDVSDSDVIRVIRRSYAGGVAAFIADGE